MRSPFIDMHLPKHKFPSEMTFFPMIKPEMRHLLNAREPILNTESGIVRIPPREMQLLKAELSII